MSLGFVLALLAAPGTEAHKGITSKYNYNEHAFPILRDRCGSCHFAGGPAPMSLVDYMQAVPWAESIREYLIGQKMPPWYVDPTGPAVKGGHMGQAISAKELDILLSWAVGGTPRAGEKTFIFGAMAGVTSPTYEGPPLQWSAGPPDLKIPMPAHTVTAGTIEEDKEFTLPTGLKEGKWVQVVDLLPGQRSMVRDALISVEGGPVLAAWVPGRQAIGAPSGTAFRIPTGASLSVKVHYKKNWQDEQETLSDRSTLGLYFTHEPLSGRSIEALTVTDPANNAGSLEPRVFGGSITSNARIVGIRPSFDHAYASVRIEAVLAAGRRVSLLKLRAPQPQWYRRYWLQEPIEIPKGSKIEVSAVPARPDEFAIPAPERYPLAVGIDYIAQ